MDFTHGGYCNLPINRPRLASLAVLYGLALAADHQVIYRLDGEQLVFSVDHGHFFPNGPYWSIASLEGALNGTVDQIIVLSCTLSQSEMALPLRQLRELTELQIAEAVASPPDTRQFSETERIAVARYLWRRRDAILKGTT